MKKILTVGRCMPSARSLRAELERITGKRYIIVTSPEKVDKSGLIIRYGSSAKLPPGIPDTQYNDPAFCQISVRKDMFSRMMLSLGLAAPEFHTSGEPRAYPVVVRTTLTGFQGKGIKVCRNADEFSSMFRAGYWWTPYVRTDYEVRAIVAGGDLVKLYYKVPFSGTETADLPIRSGYHFKRVDIGDKFGKLKAVSQSIARELNGKFFALDAGWDPSRREYFLFEVNSGFGMNDNTATLLANYLAGALGLIPA